MLSPNSARSGRKSIPAIIRLSTNAWAEFVPFLQFDREIRTIICTTNATGSINARIRRAVNASVHFPTEAGALKCVYFAITNLDPTGKGQRSMRQTSMAVRAVARFLNRPCGVERLVARGINRGLKYTTRRPLQTQMSRQMAW